MIRAYLLKYFVFFILFLTLPIMIYALKIQGISDIINKYDIFILDQWGVLHDGKTPYIGTISCTEQIKLSTSTSKIIILLSNSSKRASSAYKGLAKVGFKESLFDSIITSGEIGWNRIQQHYYDFIPITRPSKVCVFGNSEEDEEYIDSCGCELSDPEEADFCLSRGSFCFLMKSNSYHYKRADDLFNDLDKYLQRCSQANIPMLVTNPDTNRPGSNSPMPGQIGSRYAALGQRVEYIGKPYDAVYDACFAFVEKTTRLSRFDARICGVGDSLEHDIQGAEACGISSVWVTNGVHGLELDRREGSSEPAEESKVLELLSRFQVKPTYEIPCFNW
jgi:HAD superfamily hydrolase (TIGR01459 family)